MAFGLRCKIETSLVVIVACAVLHNFCIEQKDLLPPGDDELDRAVKKTTNAARVEHVHIEASTNSKNRGAVLKREGFVKMMADMNNT